MVRKKHVVHASEQRCSRKSKYRIGNEGVRGMCGWFVRCSRANDKKRRPHVTQHARNAVCSWLLHAADVAGVLACPGPTVRRCGWIAKMQCKHAHCRGVVGPGDKHKATTVVQRACAIAIAEFEEKCENLPRGTCHTPPRWTMKTFSWTFTSTAPLMTLKTMCMRLEFFVRFI